MQHTTRLHRRRRIHNRFLCIKTNGDRMVRECVFRKKLSLPRTCKLLDLSREYWRRRGIEDWGILIFEDANVSVSHTSLSCSRAPSSSVVAKHLAVLNCPIISIMLISFHDVRSGYIVVIWLQRARPYKGFRRCYRLRSL